MFQLFLAGRQNSVLEEGVPVLRIVALAMPALATINVLNGTLNGAGDTRWPWLITMSGYLLVRIPLTYVLITPTAQGGWGLGLKGAWLAMFADLYVRAVLVAGRFLQRGWLHTRSLMDGRVRCLLECVNRCPHVAVNAEQAVEVGGAEDLLEDRRELAESQLAPRGINPALDQDQLGKRTAGDEGDFREIEDQADRVSVTGQAERDLL